MKSVIALNSISKSFGAKTLFQSLSFNILNNEKVAIIGQNGSGKSTLLKIIAGLEDVESGEVVKQKNLRVAYVPQSPKYAPKLTVTQVLKKQVNDFAGTSDEKDIAIMMSLSLCGFENMEQQVSELSGGWVKRLSVACAICKEPQLLLLDEPTNHMDWETIKWLEEFLNNWQEAFILISHDRSFLNNTTNRTIEIGQAFLNEHLSFNESFDAFLEKRLSYMQEQIKQAESLSNKARRETEWLRAGVKARTTKSKARISEAHNLFNELDQVKNRIKASERKVSLGVDETGRRSKKLIEAKSLSKAYGDKTLFTDLDFKLSPGMRLSLLGDNGTGKTTLVKIIMGEVEPSGGEIQFAENLRKVYFDQSKTRLPDEQNIFEFLSEGGDHVQFKGSSLHVASYASKFLFNSDHFYLKIAQLSGGEKARLQLAKILLEPADVLILDEPTNDLDIDSIEALEDLLSELGTALILISHDRSFIKNICTHNLALEGQGEWNFYADLDQWLAVKDQPIEKKEAPKVDKEKAAPKKKLSYKDKKELESMEESILKLEAELEALNVSITQTNDASELTTLSTQIGDMQKSIAAKYQRWEELESLKP